MIATNASAVIATGDATCHGTCAGAPWRACGATFCAENEFCDGDTCKPTLAAGNECDINSDGCGEGMGCVNAYCVKFGSLAAGDTCPSSEYCQEGHYCDFATITCKPGDKTAGQNCVDDSRCAGDLICDADGVCIQPNSKTAGSYCWSNAECAAGLRCDEFLEECYAEGAMGDICAPIVGCAPGLACQDVTDATGTGTCGPLHKATESCAFFFQCEMGNYCHNIDDVCVAAKADGEFCDDDFQCSSFNCVDTMCEGFDICVVP